MKKKKIKDGNTNAIRQRAYFINLNMQLFRSKISSPILDNGLCTKLTCLFPYII